MSSKFYSVKSGGKVTIEITEEGDARARAAEKEEGGSVPHGLLPGYVPARRIVRREEPTVTFLDLGTRLRSVSEDLSVADYTRTRALEATETPVPKEGDTNEYVEINVVGQATEFDGVDVNADLNVSINGFQARIPEALYQSFEKALLGSRALEAEDTLDPLGTSQANNSARVIANCMPLPYRLYTGVKSGAIPLDLILHREGEEPLVFIASEVDRESVRLIGNPSGAPPPVLTSEFWRKREAEDTDATEKWNTVNVAQGEAFETGYLQLDGVSGSYALEVDSRLYYERFNTGDKEHFRVTAEPRVDAEEAEFSFNATSPARIFLVPVWLVLCPHRSRGGDFFFNWETWYQDYTNYGERPRLPFRSQVGVLLGLAEQSEDYPPHSGDERGSGIVYGGSYYDPNLKPGTTIITVTLSMCQASVVISGANSGSMVLAGEEVHAFPGDNRCFLQTDGGIGGVFFHVSSRLFQNPIPPNVAEGFARLETAYNGDGYRSFFGASLTTATVGRLPVYGKLYSSGWDTVSSLYPNTEGSEEATGIVLGFFRPGVIDYPPHRLIFTRRPDWDSREVAKDISDRYEIKPVSSYATDGVADGLTCKVEGSPTRFPACSSFPFGDFSTLDAEVLRIGNSLRDCIEAMPWHTLVDPLTVKDPFLNNGSSPEPYSRSLDLIPSSTTPAGRLVGIIEQGGAVFYVWATTEGDNFKPDYHREQAGGDI